MPPGQVVANEGIASSSLLEEEIEKFQFKEEETRVEAIVISRSRKKQTSTRAFKLLPL